MVGTLPQSIFVCAQDQFELRTRTWYVHRTKYARPSFVYAPCDMMYATNEVHYAFQIWFRPVQGRQLFELRTRTWYVHRTKYARPSFVYAPCDMMYVTNEILVIGNGKCRNCTSVYGSLVKILKWGVHVATYISWLYSTCNFYKASEELPFLTDEVHFHSYLMW